MRTSCWVAGCNSSSWGRLARNNGFRRQNIRSPWSDHIGSPIQLKLRNPDSGFVGQKESETPISSDVALYYLREYCELHSLNSQCIPALAASLFLPWKNSDDGASAVLPLPRRSRIPVTVLRQKSPPGSLHFEKSPQSESLLLPYFMTVSNNIRGLRALLSGSVF